MKRKALFFLLFILVSISLFAQSSNNEQRLVGTWVCDLNGLRWIFNSNSTFSGNISGEDISGKYAAVGDKIVLVIRDYSIGGDFRISNDNITLILLFGIEGFELLGFNAISFKRQ